MKISKIVTILGYIALICLAIHFVRSILKVNNDFIMDSFNFREGFSGLSNREKDVYVELSETIEKSLERYTKDNIKPLDDFVTTLPEDFKGTILDLMEEKDNIDVNDTIKSLALRAKSDPKSAIKNILKILGEIKDDNMELYEGIRSKLKGIE